MSRQDNDLSLAPIAQQLNISTVFRRIDANRVYVADIADIHAGAISHNERAFDKMIDTIQRTKNMIVIIGGDSTENAVVGGASSVFQQDKGSFDQVVYMKRKLMPIRNQIAFVRSGNHGNGRTKKINDLAPEAILAEMLNVKYCEGFGALILNARKNQYVITAHHNVKNPNKYEWLASDVDFHEHKHAQGAQRNIIAGVNGFTKTWFVKEKLSVQAGSFLNWAGYAVEKGYRPMNTGCPVLELQGDVGKWDIKVHEKVDYFIDSAKLKGDYRK